MTGKTQISLNGEVYKIKFNNYFRDEISKTFLKKGEVMLVGNQLSERIIEKWTKNGTALIRDLVYAGIVGEAESRFASPTVSKEQVAEYIGEASPEELYNIWQTFLGSQGYNLTPEEGTEDVKKKKAPKKHSKATKEN